MTRHAKTNLLIKTAISVLEEHRPMTVRQVYYQLVSRQVIENSRTAYQAVSNALVSARKSGEIPWEWIEDRLRRPRHVSMWSDLSTFAETACSAYRRDVWTTQPAYVEVWLEKDALSGIVEDELNYFGVTLNVGRGYDGWDSIHNAAERFGDGTGSTILYFGDFDPSGEDMVRSLRERLAHFGCSPEIIKCALTAGDIDRYGLPPDFTKATDSRAAKHIAKHGDICVELDALPVDVLRERVRSEIAARMNLDALVTVRVAEDAEREQLRVAIGAGARP
jgi:hypothetical protein